MTQRDYILHLQETIALLDEAVAWLERSYGKTQRIGIKDDYTPDEFDVFEALTSRFARVADILIHKVFRSLDAVEFEQGGTMIDVVNRAHKRNLFESVDEIRLIKDLRNQIAHEYIKDELLETFKDTLSFTPSLLQIVNKTKTYCSRFH